MAEEAMNTRATIHSDLATLGVRPGALLMVHASLRKIGPIAGGADALLDALRDAVGSAGTLVMPLGGDDLVPFDPLTTPAERDIGALAEVFRRRPSTQVNDHAAGRFGAAGPASAALLEPIPLHDYYGPGSPLSRFPALGGAVLRLGADLDTVTLTHWAEYLAEVPGKRRVRRPRILVDFLAAGQARTGPVGNAIAELFDGSAFVSFAVRWMETHL